ncbi:MAG: efflux RND transporter permease subunit, partial [Gammaproteobacteria bacterium]|nr:efflux RND transporter permease subunit [Gammaproteobacteria bacterium]
MDTQDNPNNQSRGLIFWFIENHVAANILMILFVVGGIVTIKNMRTETFPSIDPRLVTVSVIYPGASPNEVADSITSRVEEELVGIEGVKRVASTASEGIGIVNIELMDFANADDVYNDVETAVNSLIDFPPEDAERPIINKVRITPNVITLAIHGDVSEHTVKYWAETIEDELRQLPGVALTQLRGIRDYQISIEVPEITLQKYGLTLGQIANTIRQFAEDIPAGTIEARQGDILLRVQEKRYTGMEFQNIVVRTLPDGSSLRLGDIANIEDGFEDINLVSKFNNERAAFIDVKRSESEDTLSVADTVKLYLDTVQLPSGLKLTLQEDETINLKDRISLMIRNGILGFMLVFLILLLFLDFKLAFWTSAAIPISFLGGLMIIGNLGESLNMISLFALIVVLGIVVDDSIVTGESIFEIQEKFPDEPHSAYL